MSTPIKFIAPRIPITDPNTGALTREGVLFLQGFFDRIGGATGYSVGDLADMIASLQAGEMVVQPQQPTVMFPDLTQPAQQSVEFADIMQTFDQPPISEMVFQC